MRSVVNLFGIYAKLNQRVNSEVVASLSEMDHPDSLVDAMVAHIGLKLEDKQRLLEILYPEKRLEELYRLLRTEIEILQMEQKIRERVKKQMEKNQKEYYLSEQMRAIQKELGEKDDFSRRDEGTGEQDPREKDVQRGHSEGGEGVQEAEAHVSHVGRGDGRSKLYRLVPLPSLELLYKG